MIGGDVLRIAVTALALTQLFAIARVIVDYRPERMSWKQGARYLSLGLITLVIVAGQLAKLHAPVTWRTWVLLVALAVGNYGMWPVSKRP